MLEWSGWAFCPHLQEVNAHISMKSVRRLFVSMRSVRHDVHFVREEASNRALRSSRLSRTYASDVFAAMPSILLSVAILWTGSCSHAQDSPGLISAIPVQFSVINMSLTCIEPLYCK